MGNAINECWENSIDIKSVQWVYDAPRMILSIACPSDSFSFDIEYYYVAWTNVLNNNAVTVYDNETYEMALPVCQDEVE